MSAFVDKATVPALQPGLRVRVSRDLDVTPYGRVRAGEHATVTYADHETGEVELVLDVVHDNLRDWRNCLILMPFDTDEWLEGLELVSVLEAKEMPERKLGSA